MEQEVLNLANKQIQLVISNALNSISQISSSIFQNQLFKPTVPPIRCRSSSYSRNNRKGPFHNNIPRYSIPTTKNDFVHYQSRYQTSLGFNKIFDVQYSFSLNEPRLTQTNPQQQNLKSIENFADQFIKHSIQFALLEISYEHSTSDSELSDEDEPSCLPNECLLAIDSYVDRFIHCTIKQAIGNISLSKIECFSSRLTEDIIADALSMIADDEIDSRSILTDDEKCFRKMKKKSVQFEDSEQFQVSQNSYHNNNSNVEESIDNFVINIAQQIYVNSFDQLRQLFTEDNTTNNQ